MRKEDWFYHYEERAAIAEYDGELSRREAEALAMKYTIHEMMSFRLLTSWRKTREVVKGIIREKGK